MSDAEAMNNVALGGRWVVQCHSQNGSKSVSIWEREEVARAEFALELGRAKERGIVSVSLLWEAARVR